MKHLQITAVCETVKVSLDERKKVLKVERECSCRLRGRFGSSRKSIDPADCASCDKTTLSGFRFIEGVRLHNDHTNTP